MESSYTNVSSPTNRRNGGPSLSEWEVRPLSELIRHIVERHHTWLRGELPAIAQLIRHTIEKAGHARARPFGEIERLFRKFQRETENHLKKEESVLFPLIEKLESRVASGVGPESQSFGPLRNPVQFMTEDHELAERLLAKMKEMVVEDAAAPDLAAERSALLERLKTVEADLEIHVKLEDQILFPRAIRLEEGEKRPGL